MYRPKRGLSLKALVVIAILGAVLGGGFYLYDNLFKREPNVFVSQPPPVLPTEINLLPTSVAPPPTPSKPQPSASASILIPSVGVYAPVITAYLRDSTWDVTNLGTNVGYLQETAWIGSTGNIVLSGHVEMSDGRLGVFEPLQRVQIGDNITLSEGAVTYTYTVTEIRKVDPTDLSVIQPTPTDRLTLITCDDYDFLQNSYSTRLVVIAERDATRS